MKTKEELNTLKEEAETMNKKLAELNEEELEQVSGGLGVPKTHSHGRLFLCLMCNQEFTSYGVPESCPRCGVGGNDDCFELLY